MRLLALYGATRTRRLLALGKGRQDQDYSIYFNKYGAVFIYDTIQRPYSRR